jgi:hypothetical protein
MIFEFQWMPGRKFGFLPSDYWQHPPTFMCFSVVPPFHLPIPDQLVFCQLVATMTETMSDFTADELAWTPRLSASSDHGTIGDDPNTISPVLALFLQNLLKDASCLVTIVADNIRGLPKEKASSYVTTTVSPRLSDSSVPELCRHRWGAESHGVDHSRRLASLAEHMTFDSGDMDSSLTRAPLVPRRRCSIDSVEGIGDDMWASDTEDEDDCFRRAYSANICESGDDQRASQFRPDEAPAPWQVRYAALQETRLSELDDRDAVVKTQHEIIDNNNNNNKCLRSPPKAPERQASLRQLRCKPDLLTTNLSIPSEDQLDTAEVQKVHRRRCGVSFLASSDPLTSLLNSSHRGGNQPTLIKESPSLVLEKMYREVCIAAADFDEDDETERQDKTTVFHDVLEDMSTSRIETQINRDFLPSCAKRRPSPQLEKCSFHGTDSMDASPVRAKRRPSPELEAFSCLVEALASVKKQ